MRQEWAAYHLGCPILATAENLILKKSIKDCIGSG